MGRGFDDKVGAFVVTEVLRRLKSERVQAAVFCVATVQEEVGSRGVRACAYEIHPDIGIAIDVITATDSPEADKRAAGEVSLHKGPVLQKGCDINPVLGDLLIDTAERNKIPFQIGAAPGPTWTDASALQGIRGGSATAVVRIPNRYMHAPTEVVSLRDVDNAILLLVALIRRLRPGMDFRPLSAPNRTARPGRERSR